MVTAKSWYKKINNQKNSNNCQKFFSKVLMSSGCYPFFAVSVRRFKNLDFCTKFHRENIWTKKRLEFFTCFHFNLFPYVFHQIVGHKQFFFFQNAKSHGSTWTEYYKDSIIHFWFHTVSGLFKTFRIVNNFKCNNRVVKYLSFKQNMSI